MMGRKQKRIFSKIEGIETDSGTWPAPAPPPRKDRANFENHAGSMPEGVMESGPAEDTSISEELIVLNSPDSFFAERCRFLRSKITRSTADTPTRSVLVTSALPGEGKTLIACNLAASIGQSPEEFALLVDADLRSPGAHRVFGIASDTRGLAAYLAGQAGLPELIKRTAFDRLSFLAAGDCGKGAAELLSSAKMRELILELRERYNDRYVIIDSAPLELAPEVAVIANMVDVVVLVVRHGMTPRSAVMEAKKKISKEKLIGVVYNGYDGAFKLYDRYGSYYNKKR